MCQALHLINSKCLVEEEHQREDQEAQGAADSGVWIFSTIGHGSAAFHWDQSWANKSIQEQELCGLVANNPPASSLILLQGCARKGNTLPSRSEMLPGGPARPLPSTEEVLSLSTEK